MQSIDCFATVYSTEVLINDHSFLLAGDTWHLFHICYYPDGATGDVIGHATSKDLRHWQRQPGVVPKAPAPSWEAARGGNAPYAVAWEGRYYLFYSRYEMIDPTLPSPDRQQIGLAVSNDLFTWEKHPENPIFHPAPFWCPWEDEPKATQYRPRACRDPHVMRIGDQFVMYYVAMTRKPRICAVAHAVSGDLVHWVDHGPVTTLPICSEKGDKGQIMAESPCVVWHAGRWHLFFVHGLGMYWGTSDTPFEFPEATIEYHAHAAEVFRWGDDWYMSSCMGTGGLGLARLDMDQSPPNLETLP